jgi:murein DD-endopeptidase MepM/ murein hydrolase activator NlpD
MRFLLTLGLYVLSAGADSPEARTLARGRALTDLLREGKVQPLWDQMTDRMRGAIGTPEALGVFRDRAFAELGAEADILEEKAMRVDGYDVYRRKGRWSKAPVPVLIEWSLDSEDKIAGFHIRPAPPEPALSDYQTKAPLRLPFRGTWHVFWGGRTPEQNYHVNARDQRFAYDLVMHRDGKSHRGDGSRPEDYYCWDQPILAPAAGTIVAAVDEFPDQKPGTMDAKNPPGNHVIVDLGNGEYALLAHLRRGSVKVKAGATVKAGAELGRCGNSGNTSEPHLHFHLQNAARFGEGDGLPAFFNDYIADGKPVARGEPVKGQEIAAAK